jgi:hypothetical protein
VPDEFSLILINNKIYVNIMTMAVFEQKEYKPADKSEKGKEDTVMEGLSRKKCNNPDCQYEYTFDPDDPNPKCPYCGTPPVRSEGVAL